jgi:spermidine/putrescine transport system permease protein
MTKGRLHLAFCYFVLTLFFIFLYAPILSLFVSSFKQNGMGYIEMFSRTDLLTGFVNSFYTAALSVIISLVISLVTLGFVSMMRTTVFSMVSYVNLIIPEIILAISLLLFFNVLSIELGFKTLVLSHSILSLGYVFLLLYYRFVGIDKMILEAGKDLGANVWISWKTIILPILTPSIIIGCALAFILSFDDFIFSYFCSNPDFQTLPLVFLSILRTEPSPSFYAFSVSLLAACFFGLIIYHYVYANRENEETR